MPQERIIYRCRKFLLAGTILIILVFLTPDDAKRESGGFFSLATQTTWTHFLDLPAAWCSCKIILLSFGFFLVIECLGTYLAMVGYRRLAWGIYLLHLLPSALFLMGVFYLLKALL